MFYDELEVGCSKLDAGLLGKSPQPHTEPHD